MKQKVQESKTILVLMLDSEKKLLEATKRYLYKKQINVLAVENTSNAWIQMEKIIPDCVVMDNLPNVDTHYPFIFFMRKSEKFRHIPVIFLTAKGLTEDRIYGYSLGCTMYISKPFDPRELEYMIKNIVMSKNIWMEYLLSNYILIQESITEIKKKFKIISCLSIRLTCQEELILRRILFGYKIKEVARDLNVTKRNVERYISRLLDKTQTKTVSQLKELPWDTLLKPIRANDGNRTRE
jgi:DNA-binding NarL/FixJ family response regulator|uniref:hypothetical protein ycf29 n=1 Tax=Cryptomonas gyropyrenoidosa TaxID=233257 RepID=UPI00279CD44F|nr:hypothetical protein ycf29 [Cryptomonas gyropyrenoidosa]WFQ83047.1 hypothetical protein ycf29 [Cryptomonas gyropyrenoidosa]